MIQIMKHAGFLICIGFISPNIHAKQSCQLPPPAVIDIKSASIYGDSKDIKSHASSEGASKRASLVKDINSFLTNIAKDSDAYISDKSEERARCALAAMEKWASSGALLGSTDSEAAKKELIWNSAGISISYLKIKRLATQEQRKIIEPWIKEISDRVVTRYSGAQNNILCWIALVSTASGLATDDKNMVASGLAYYQRALSEVDHRGSLPKEIARGPRALAYHDFALAPLLVTQALLDNSGLSIPNNSKTALSKLARFTHLAHRNASEITQLAGVTQDDPGTRNYYYWMYLADGRIDDIEKIVISPAPFDRWFGGSATYFRMPGAGERKY